MVYKMYSLLLALKLGLLILILTQLVSDESFRNSFRLSDTIFNSYNRSTSVILAFYAESDEQATENLGSAE